MNKRQISQHINKSRTRAINAGLRIHTCDLNTSILERDFQRQPTNFKETVECLLEDIVDTKYNGSLERKYHTDEYNNKHNSTLIFTGHSYGIICVSISNYIDVLEKIINLHDDHNCISKPFTCETPSKIGYANEYYRVTEEQQLGLEKMESVSDCFIDRGITCTVYYNNCVTLGPSVIDDNPDYHTHICYVCKEVPELPMFIYDEILYRLKNYNSYISDDSSESDDC